MSDHHGPTPAAAMTQQAESDGIDNFLSDVGAEVVRAISKFPQPNPTLAALTEEVGELAKAVLHIREGKSSDWWRVHDEAVQVATMACRVALEGDPTVGAVPTEKNCT